jgi:peptidoglycan/LPS O-acetylase OafA/YrhL
MAARQNNFDTLRLLAASAVLVSHAFTLSGAGAEPLIDFSHDHKDSLGQLAVIVFFAISGYLITASYANVGNALGFIWRRALRIMPALIVVLVLTAFVMGPMVSNMPARAYLGQREPYSYVFWNLLFRTQYSLPGVFTSNPFPNAVNGSLWTLKPEVECYAAVLTLGLCRLLNRWALLVASLLLSALLALHPGTHPELLELATPFAVGGLLYLVDVPLDWRVAVLAVLACAATLHYGGFNVTASWAGTYLVHFVARSPMVRLPQLPIDPSYGIYIWAFPVQQLLATYIHGPQAWWWNVIIAFPITFLLAVASYLAIEKPALNLKRLRIPTAAARKISLPPMPG